jgi:hypothetical protein
MVANKLTSHERRAADLFADPPITHHRQGVSTFIARLHDQELLAVVTPTRSVSSAKARDSHMITSPFCTNLT